MECPADASCSVGVEVRCSLLYKIVKGAQITICGVTEVNVYMIKVCYWVLQPC